MTHKERLKELSRGVDVLTLSATPIPRTLNMALSGLRDMSTIEQPPQDRYPVQTFVLEHQDGILDEAMRRELARGGQVYYLHNRVESIDQCAAKIKQRIPEAEIAVAHGKMNEEQLGDVMQSMSNGEIQILVCTTIIETGIDIPNVNTLIIEDADRLGLAQLHQIRGRVGRSSRHAYAYLTFRKGKVLSEIAEKRLDTIREYAEFGSGFKIAMRDLEIRGAGDLLGAEQSGHMMTVGYDMYLKLLEDAVLEERGEEAQKEPECTADLTVTANINKDYVSSGEQRMDLYRRMAAIRTKEDADELLDEIVDRFGDPPKGVMNLIAIALLRARRPPASLRSRRRTAPSSCPSPRWTLRPSRPAAPRRSSRADLLLGGQGPDAVREAQKGRGCAEARHAARGDLCRHACADGRRVKLLIENSEFRGPFLSGMPLQKNRRFMYNTDTKKIMSPCGA